MASVQEEQRLSRIIENLRNRRTPIPAHAVAAAIDKLHSDPSMPMCELFQRIAASGAHPDNRSRGETHAPPDRQQVVSNFRRRNDPIDPTLVAAELHALAFVPTPRMLELFEGLSRDSALMRFVNVLAPCFGPPPLPPPAACASPDTLNVEKKRGLTPLDAPTVVSILIDSSTSMKPMWREVVESVRGFLKEAAENRSKHRISMTLFDRKCHNVYRFLPAKQAGNVPSYTGLGQGTALYDALGAEITELETFRQLNPHYENALILVYSDGIDNMSEVYDVAKIRSKVLQVIAEGWNIVFICRTEEAERVAEKVGADLAVDNEESGISIGTMTSSGFEYLFDG